MFVALSGFAIANEKADEVPSAFLRASPSCGYSTGLPGYGRDESDITKHGPRRSDLNGHYSLAISLKHYRL